MSTSGTAVRPSNQDGARSSALPAEAVDDTLLAFSKPLRQLKEATLLAAASVATRRERAVERELLGKNMAAPAEADATAAADIPDASKLHAAAKKLSTFLISRAAIVPVAAAALLPLVAAAATQLPIRELLKIAKGLLLL
jgi:hypothetical protein